MNLKQKRAEKHISLKGVSEEINIHRDTFSKIEKGLSDLPTRCINKIAFLYGTTPEEIIELHEKDIQKQAAKVSLIEQMDKAQIFLKSNDRKYVKEE